MPKVLEERRTAVLQQQSADHDLLIRLDQKMNTLSLDIKELKDNTASRVAALELEKANQKELDAVRAYADSNARRITKLENYYIRVAAITGAALVAVELYARFVHH
jgi:hypothetical protein